MSNVGISSVALPLTATPKGKNGVTKLTFIYVEESKLKSLT